MDRQDIAAQVKTTLGDHPDDFDVDSIVDDLHTAGVESSVDDIDGETYWEIVRKHDNSMS